jgi:hypothetical protein
MLGQDVAKVGSVEDVFEGGEDFDPYRRSILGGNEPARSVNFIKGYEENIPCRVKPY